MLAGNTSAKFTPLQQELLKLYSSNLPEDDLVIIKDLTGKYFMEKLRENMNKSVNKSGYTQDDFDAWLNNPKQCYQ